MKTKNFSLSVFFFAMVVIKSSAQAPHAIPYQAVARDSSGNTIANQIISLRFSLHDSTPAGIILYQETQSVMTNLLGLLYADIGRGTPVIGTLDSVSQWGYNPIWLQVEMDATGGFSYSDMGTQQLLSVPYALFANVSREAADAVWSASGTDIYNNNNGKVGVGTDTPGSKLSVKGNMSIGDSASSLSAPPNGLNVDGQILIGIGDRNGLEDFNGAFLAINDGRVRQHSIGLAYLGMIDSAITNSGIKMSITASDSAIGSNMKLSGTSDSAVVIGNIVTASGIGKGFIGSVTRLEWDLDNDPFFSIGSDIQLTARDAVTGSNMNLTGGSDSAVIIGNRTISNGTGKKFIANYVGFLDSDGDGLPDSWEVNSTIGSDIHLAARDSVTGSNMILRGGSDSAVVIGNRIVVSGSGKEVIGHATLIDMDIVLDIATNVVGSDTRIIARDSITGSNMNLRGGSDSAVVIGNRTVVSGSGKEFIGNDVILISIEDHVDMIGMQMKLEAKDSVTGSNMFLRGGSDSASVYGSRTVVSGNGEKFIGASRLMEEEGIFYYFSIAVGSEERLTATDSVTGSKMMLRGGSDSAVVIGQQVVYGGSGKEFIGIFAYPGIIYSDSDTIAVSKATGTEMHMIASDSVIGSNTYLTGASDSAIVIGSSITANGSGKKSVGYSYTATATDPAGPLDPLSWSIATGTEINVSARDSVTGVSLVVDNGSDSTKINGLTIKLGPNAAGSEPFYGDKKWCFRVIATDGLGNKSIGTDLILAGKKSIAGHKLTLAGTSDSSKVTGLRVIPQGEGIKFRGFSTSFLPETDDEVLVYFPTFKFATGSELKVTGVDSVIGSDIVLKAGSDSTKMIGLQIKAGPNAGNAVGSRTWCFGVRVNDDAAGHQYTTGVNLTLSATDSVTGSNSVLKGGSDSAVVIGHSTKVSGSGKEFIGNVTELENYDFPGRYSRAVGSEIHIAARDTVIGSDIVIDKGSDSTKMLGIRIRPGPNDAGDYSVKIALSDGTGKKFTGYAVQNIGDGDIYGPYGNFFQTGFVARLNGSNAVIGSSNILKGASDSAVVIGNSTLVSGSGKEFLGNVTKLESYDYPGEYYQKAVGSDIKLTASDSVVGSRIVVANGNDTTKVMAVELKGGNISDGSTNQWPTVLRMVTTDDAWKTIAGSDLEASAPISVTGNRLQLRGVSDSAKIKGIVILPEGTGSDFTGVYMNNSDSGDTGTHEVGHWMGRVAVGSDIRLTAIDSVTGSHVSVVNGSDSTKVCGLRVDNATDPDLDILSYQSMTLIQTDDGWKNSTGTNLVLSAPQSVFGHNLMLTGTSDSARINGITVIPQGTGERFIAFRDDPYAEDAARLIPTHKTSIGNDFHIYATDSAIGSNNFLYGSNDSTVVIGQRITNSGNAKEFIGNITLQSSEASIICWRVVGSDTRLTASDSVTGSRFNLTGLNSNTIVQGQKINIVGQGQNVGTDISVNGGSNNIGLRSVTNGIGAAAIFSGTSGAHALLVDAGNVGIGTSVPSSLFSVGQNNQFQVDFSGDIKRINNVPYSFPSNQGSNGQALLNDGAGNLTWVHSATGGDLSGALTNATVVKLQGVPVSASVPTNGQVLKYNGTTSQWEPGNPTPNVAYEAGVQAPLTIPQSVVTTIVFGAETFDDGLSYNPATGIFTVPATGRYHFDASVQWQNPTFAIGRFEMQLKVNNALTKNTYTTFNQDFSQALSIDLALNAGDQVKVTVVQNSAGPINLVGGLTASTFSGHQLY